MDWRHKARLQRLFSAVPGGHRLNYLFQCHVTRGQPISDAKLAEVVALGQHHVDMVRRHGAVPLGDARFFEFGAGWDLAMPLVLWSLGVDAQHIVDIRPLARPALVTSVAARLRDADLARALPALHGDDVVSLVAPLGIRYDAPRDARHTELPAGSIDVVTSTNTLEHIPPSDIAAILRECHRLLADDGVASFQVDYQDHYSYFDGSVTAYEFLQFSEQEWRRWNPSLHHQNRLRHSDYLARYDDAGFDVVAADVTAGSPADVETARALADRGRFGTYAECDLAVRGSRAVLRKRPA